MTKRNGLGRRALSAAMSAALALSLCPMAPIQEALAEEAGGAASPPKPSRRALRVTGL